MPKFYINDTGTWRNASEVWLNDAGTWRSMKQIWVKKNGVWRRIFRHALEISISADTQDYDLFAAAGSPTAALDLVLTIDLDVVVGATTTAAAGLYCSADFPAGTTVEIINKGKIIGAGGEGGKGGNSFNKLSEGYPGGPALSLGAPTTINNTAGYIFGGGGGGGTMYFQGVIGGNGSHYAMAGGGGAGWTAGIGGVFGSGAPAEDGTETLGGRARVKYLTLPGGVYMNEYRGGSPGSPGQVRYETSDGQPVGYKEPGAAGRAVDRNGFGLTFLSGENANQLKGAYD